MWMPIVPCSFVHKYRNGPEAGVTHVSRVWAREVGIVQAQIHNYSFSIPSSRMRSPSPDAQNPLA